jgi:hypothetical protein
MPDDPGLIDLEITILLLPSVSRGAHLDWPILYARHLIELWKLDNPGDVVPLTRAFRLLDEKALEGAILRASAAEDYLGNACDCRKGNDANDDRSQRDDHTLLNFPNAQILLSELRAVVWQAMLAGTLVTEAIKGVRGNRYRIVLPTELPRLTQDWRLSRLMLDGCDEFIDVRVRRAPTTPLKKTWRDKPSDDEVEAAMRAYDHTYPLENDPPSIAEVVKAIRDGVEGKRAGVPGATQQQIEDAVKKCAPRLRRGRGRRW